MRLTKRARVTLFLVVGPAGVVLTSMGDDDFWKVALGGIAVYATLLLIVYGIFLVWRRSNRGRRTE